MPACHTSLKCIASAAYSLKTKQVNQQSYVVIVELLACDMFSEGIKEGIPA